MHYNIAYTVGNDRNWRKLVTGAVAGLLAAFSA